MGSMRRTTCSCCAVLPVQVVVLHQAEPRHHGLVADGSGAERGERAGRPGRAAADAAAAARTPHRPAASSPVSRTAGAMASACVVEQRGERRDRLVERRPRRSEDAGARDGARREHLSITIAGRGEAVERLLQARASAPPDPTRPRMRPPSTRATDCLPRPGAESRRSSRAACARVPARRGAALGQHEPRGRREVARLQVEGHRLFAMAVDLPARARGGSPRPRVRRRQVPARRARAGSRGTARGSDR